MHFPTHSSMRVLSGPEVLDAGGSELVAGVGGVRRW